MVSHTEILLSGEDGAGIIRSLIRKGVIQFGGNRKLKIYGRLNCRSGKRMKVNNRVFFTELQDALNHGYRPCGHCLRQAYREWKNNQL